MKKSYYFFLYQMMMIRSKSIRIEIAHSTYIEIEQMKNTWRLKRRRRRKQNMNNGRLINYMRERIGQGGGDSLLFLFYYYYYYLLFKCFRESIALR
jgi:hypothetical protein